MTTRLDKTLKRELTLEGRTFVLAVSPEGLKLTLKGKRKGQELRWGDLVSGDAALATALNASLGTFAADEAAARTEAPEPAAPPLRAERARTAGARKPKSSPRKSAAPVRPSSKRLRHAGKR
jgi:hypothetical protein